MTTAPIIPPCGYRPEDFAARERNGGPKTLADVIRGVQLRAGEPVVVDIVDVPERFMQSVFELMVNSSSLFDRGLGKAAWFAPCTLTRLRVIRAFPEVFRPYIEEVKCRELTGQ